jgi:hypothetical protein|tara:strand:- start:31 stop:699 length:669 start_codon:yes stop_codon:yes gene_type:complete
MRKLIHVVNINDFFPELFALTYPTIRSYAERNGYMINMITERKFPDYPINYEKMQVYEDGKDAEVNILCDADMLIHPQFPDVTEFLKRDSIAFNDNYNISWKYHVDRIRYFMRDGRDVGIATNFVVSSDWTHDVWEPLSLSQKDIEDLAKKENTDTGGADGRGWGHYADEFALSYNMAKYGLKYTGVTWEDWMRPWLIHTGTGDKNEALQIARQTLEKWSRL